MSLNTHSDPVRNKLQTQYFKMNYPIHYERMKGIAAGFGVDCNNFANNISEITYLPIKTNCSVVFYPKDKTQNNHNLLSRNFDMPIGNLQMQKCKGNELPTFSRPIIFEVYPDTGYSSLYICSGELIGGVFDGINSQGLSVAILGDGIYSDGFLPEPSNEIGLHELLIMRYLLDNCKNTTEAKEALLYLKQYYSFTPCHYIIADNEGHSFIFEFSRMRNQSHVIDGTGIQCITNHLISDQKPGKTPEESKNRLELLEKLTSADKKYTLEEIKNINSQVSPPLTQNYGPNLAPCRTLWHSIYDMDEKSLMVRFYLGEEVQPDNSIKARYSDYYEIKLSK
jgi:predicted choloylglycine hydrolase